MADLPDFDGSSAGRQGVGGVPPELWKQAAAQIGAVQKPEDSPEVNQVLDNEAEMLRQQFGGEPQDPPTPREERQQQQEEQPPQQQTEPTQEEHPESTITTERLKEIRARFRGNFPKLAEGYDQALQELQHRRESATGSELAELKEQIARLQGELAATRASSFLNTQNVQPPSQAPQRQEEEEIAIDRDSFLEDPASNTAKVMRSELRRFAQAIAERDAEKERQRAWDARQEVFSQYKDRMGRIYSKNPDRWERMDRLEAMNTLLEMAQLEEAADAGRQIYMQMNEGAPVSPAQNGGGVSVPYSTIPTSGGARVGNAAPGSAPPGGWSNTNAVKRLWRSRDGGADETRALMDVLKERGH